MRTWLQYFLEMIIIFSATNGVVRIAGILAACITSYFWLRGRGAV